MSSGCYYYKHGRRSEPTVALTFDDGPNPPRTEQIVHVLNETGVPGNFFLLGKWAERYPETVRRLISGGHLVGNHGYAGDPHLGDADQAEIAISYITGEPCRYLRAHTFNYASFFNAEVTRLPFNYVIDGEISGEDWRYEYNFHPITTADEIVSNVLDSPQLGPGAIIVLHDGCEFDAPAMHLLRPLPTVHALPRIIAGLLARGLQPVRLDQMEFDAPIEWIGLRAARGQAQPGSSATPNV